MCMGTLDISTSQDTPPVRQVLTLNVWPDGKMPGHGAAEPEEDLPSRGDHVRRITNVSEPAGASRALKSRPPVARAALGVFAATEKAFSQELGLLDLADSKKFLDGAFRRDFERHVAEHRCPWRAP